MEKLKALVVRVFAWLKANEWIPILLVRLCVGYEFASSGWGKVHRLEKLAEDFRGWGIPAPAFNATLTAVTELVGGTLLILGLGTRFAAAPLAITMTVAILTVQAKTVHTLSDFFYLSEPCFWLLFVWLFFSGGGKASLDHLIASRSKSAGAPSPSKPA